MKKSWLNVCVILLTICICVGIGVGLFIGIKNKKQDDNSGQSTSDNLNKNEVLSNCYSEIYERINEEVIEIICCFKSVPEMKLVNSDKKVLEKHIQYNLTFSKSCMMETVKELFEVLIVESGMMTVNGNYCASYYFDSNNLILNYTINY